MKNRCWLIIAVLYHAILSVNTVQAEVEGSIDDVLRQRNLEVVIRQSPALTALRARQDWLEHLANPTISNEQQILAFADTCATISRFLDEVERLIGTGAYPLPYALPFELYEAKRLAQLFITVMPRDTTMLTAEIYYVNLGTTDDPAVRALREQVGIPPPPGYVFIRFFPNRAAMPEAFQPIFANEKVNGATLGCRYIVVLGSPTNNPDKLRQATLGTTISHELVHAYINATVGHQAIDSLPPWFHEGCATFFSGSGGSRTVVDYSPKGRVYRTSEETDDYHLYRQVFKYLERRAGRKGLHAGIKQAIEQHSTQPLLSLTSISSDWDLLTEVRDHHRFWRRVFWGIGIGTVLLIILWFRGAGKPQSVPRSVGSEPAGQTRSSGAPIITIYDTIYDESLHLTAEPETVYSTTRLTFNRPLTESTRIIIYSKTSSDIPAGTIVRDIALEPGTSEFTWDRRGDDGRLVPRGWYTVACVDRTSFGETPRSLTNLIVQDD